MGWVTSLDSAPLHDFTGEDSLSIILANRRRIPNELYVRAAAFLDRNLRLP